MGQKDTMSHQVCPEFFVHFCFLFNVLIYFLLFFIFICFIIIFVFVLDDKHVFIPGVFKLC